MAPQDPIIIQHRDAPATEVARIPVFTVQRPNPEYEAFQYAWDTTDHAVPDVPVPANPHEPTVDTVYTMPAKPNPGIALEYMRQARQNADLAASWLIEEQIGSDGYTALVEEMQMLDDAEASALFEAIAIRIRDVSMGGLEAPKG